MKELRNIEVIRKTDKKKQKQKIAGSFMLIKEPAYTYIYIFIFFCSCCFFCNIVQSEIIWCDNDNYNNERNPNKSHSGRLMLEWFILIKKKKMKKNLEHEWDLTILAIYTYIVLASKNIRVFRNKENKKKIWQVYFNRYLL